MNNNQPKKAMTPEEIHAHYLKVREENAKLIKMREEAVKEVERLQREVKSLNDAQIKRSLDSMKQSFRVDPENEELKKEVKNLTETNAKLNDALMDQSIKAYDANARSEELSSSMTKWIKLHDLKAKENIELKSKVHTLEAQHIDNQKEIEWQREQKNRLREKLEDLRKNPIGTLKNCIVWDKDGVKRYNENGMMSTTDSMGGVVNIDYSALPINSIGILKSGKEPEKKYVYAILPYPNHKDMIIFKDADKAFETLNNQGPSNEHNLIMQRFEVKE